MCIVYVTHKDRVEAGGGAEGVPFSSLSTKIYYTPCMFRGKTFFLFFFFETSTLIKKIASEKQLQRSLYVHERMQCCREFVAARISETVAFLSPRVSVVSQILS